MFTPVQQSTALATIVMRLELLPGVTTFSRDHGRPLLVTLVTLTLFLLVWSILIAGVRETQENIQRHLFNKLQKKKKKYRQKSRGESMQ